LDSQGREIAVSRRKSQPRSGSYDSIISHIKEDKSPDIRLVGEGELMLAIPVLADDGKITAILAGFIDLKQPSFFSEISSHPYGKSGVTMVMDLSSGKFLATTDNTRVLKPLPEPGLNTQHDLYLTGYEGSGTAVNSVGIEELMSGVHIKEFNWLIVVATPTEDAFAVINRLSLFIIIISTLLSAILIFIFHSILNRNFRPLLETIKDIDQMKFSQDSHNSRVLPDTEFFSSIEITSLRESFNSLMRIIQKKEIELLREKEKNQRELQNQVDTEIAKRSEAEKENEIQKQLMIQQSKMAEIGQMMGAIAHQWNQPLNSIALIVQTLPDYLEDGLLDSQTLKHQVGNVIKQVKFLSTTLEDFRNFFKPSGKPENFNLYKTSAEVIHLLDAQLHKHNIEVEISGSGSKCATGYPNEFKQVILNLINNAKDILLERNCVKPEIRIFIAENPDGSGSITVSDNGGGIADHLLPEKLFEPFQSTKGDNGMGIGLSLSRKILQKIGAQITAENGPDGAVFTISFSHKNVGEPEVMTGMFI